MVGNNRLSKVSMGALPEKEDRHIPRPQDRQMVLIGVRVRRKGESWFRSRITDMSLDGFRLLSFVKLQIGMEIWVMFPGFEGRRAKVVWIADHEAGCAFENPLHPAIFDHIIRTCDLRARG